MRRFIIFLLLAVGVAAPASLSAAPTQRVLLVVSGHGEDEGKTRPGFEFDEFAQAYAIFRDNGLAVDVASPRGGRVEADGYDPEKAYNADVLGDPEAMRKLAATRSTRELTFTDYAAVFVIGGKGAMFDLPNDPALKRLLVRTYESGGVVAAVCHGPAALVDVRLTDGTLLVSGKRVAGFTNEEEAMFGKKWANDYPFLLEDELRRRGGRFAEAALMLPFVQVDGRIVTGQNPYSTAPAVEATLRAMGRTPIARPPYADERSLLLVGRFLGGEVDWARGDLAAEADQHDPALIAMWGYFRAQDSAADRNAVADGLAVMELAAPYFQDPRLELGMAEAEHRLGRKAQALRRAEKLLAQRPDMDEAKKLVAAMTE